MSVLCRRYPNLLEINAFSAIFTQSLKYNQNIQYLDFMASLFAKLGRDHVAQLDESQMARLSRADATRERIGVLKRARGTESVDVVDRVGVRDTLHELAGELRNENPPLAAKLRSLAIDEDPKIAIILASMLERPGTVTNRVLDQLGDLDKVMYQLLGMPYDGVHKITSLHGDFTFVMFPKSGTQGIGHEDLLAARIISRLANYPSSLPSDNVTVDLETRFPALFGLGLHLPGPTGEVKLEFYRDSDTAMHRVSSAQAVLAGTQAY